METQQNQSVKERVRAALKFMMESSSKAEKLRYTKFAYYPIVIADCIASYPASFPKISLYLEHFGDAFGAKCPFVHFNTLMRSGIQHLSEFLEKDVKPDASVQSLLSFLEESDKHGSYLQNLKEMEEIEASATIGLAIHLFSQLFPGKRFILDKDMKNMKKKCQCGCETSVESNYKDTGMGHNAVWHGCADIILKSKFDVPARVTTEELTNRFGQTSLAEKEPIDDNIPVEVKIRDERVLDHDEVTAQIIAQAIVNSFANANKSNKGSTTFPVLGSTLDHISVYFYDCKEDILIGRGAHIEIWKEGMKYGKISDVSILELWLLLNFQPVLPESVLKNFPKSNFRKFVRTDKVLECYKASETCVNIAELWTHTGTALGFDSRFIRHVRDQFSHAPDYFDDCEFQVCD